MRITSASDPLRILLIGSSSEVERLKPALRTAMQQDFSLTVAARLEEGLGLLAEEGFDVALLGGIQDEAGFSGLDRLRQAAPDLPIVVLAESRDAHLACNALSNGAQDYLFTDHAVGHGVRRCIQYAIMRKQFEGVLVPRANVDPLTGLGDRRLFESRLDMAKARMKRRGRDYAVLLLDIDGFQPINAAAGRLAGDALLKLFAQRLRAAFRPHDTIARFKADHFAILVEDVSVAGSEAVAEKVIGLLSAPFQFHDHAIRLEASIGIATCAAGQEMTGKALIAQADAAMHDAKLTAGNCCRSFAGLLSHLAQASAVMVD